MVMVVVDQLEKRDGKCGFASQSVCLVGLYSYIEIRERSDGGVSKYTPKSHPLNFSCGLFLKVFVFSFKTGRTSKLGSRGVIKN